jgi:hypothetical protein
MPPTVRSPMETRNVLVGHGRVPQHGIGRVFQRDRLQLEGLKLPRDSPHVAVHARRLAEDHLERHVHGLLVEERIVHQQLVVGARAPHHREEAALARADASNSPSRDASIAST